MLTIRIMMDLKKNKPFLYILTLKTDKNFDKTCVHLEREESWKEFITQIGFIMTLSMKNQCFFYNILYFSQMKIIRETRSPASRIITGNKKCSKPIFSRSSSARKPDISSKSLSRLFSWLDIIPDLQISIFFYFLNLFIFSQPVVVVKYDCQYFLSILIFCCKPTHGNKAYIDKVFIYAFYNIFYLNAVLLIWNSGRF